MWLRGMGGDLTRISRTASLPTIGILWPGRSRHGSCRAATTSAEDCSFAQRLRRCCTTTHGHLAHGIIRQTIHDEAAKVVQRTYREIPHYGSWCIASGRGLHGGTRPNCSGHIAQDHHTKLNLHALCDTSARYFHADPRDPSHRTDLDPESTAIVFKQTWYPPIARRRPQCVAYGTLADSHEIRSTGCR